MIHVEAQPCDIGSLVALKGESERDDVATLAHKVMAALPQSPGIIGLDFSLVVSLTSSLVIPLLQLRNAYNKPDEGLFLIDTPAEFRFALQVAKVNHLFQFVSSIAHFRQAMRGMRIILPQDLMAKPVIRDVLEGSSS